MLKARVLAGPFGQPRPTGMLREGRGWGARTDQHYNEFGDGTNSLREAPQFVVVFGCGPLRVPLYDLLHYIRLSVAHPLTPDAKKADCTKNFSPVGGQRTPPHTPPQKTAARKQ